MGVHYGKADFITYGKPSLFLDFANKKSLVDRISGNNLITFTRTSSATYVGADGLIKSAAVNVPRFDHNPVTGESLGLLVEEARTNLATYSQYPGQAGWNAVGVVIELNAAQAPDNTFTASKITSTQANSSHTVQRPISNSNTFYTMSAYIKPNGVTWLAFYTAFSTNPVCWFNLSTGTVGTRQSRVISSSITTVGNGWYYLTATVNSDSTGTGVWGIYHTQADNNLTAFAGDGVSGYYLWGFQVELGSFPTSHVPTPATFTGRTSTATFYDASGIIQTAASGVARSNAFFPDANGVMRPAGLLLEAAGTNSKTYSEDFTQEFYHIGTSAVSTNNVSPSGTSNATRINFPGAGTRFVQGSTAVTPGVWTFSLWMRNVNAGTANIHLILQTSPGVDAGSGVSVTNTWQRFSTTQTITTGGGGIQVKNFTANNYTLEIWGAQVETGTYPTSYIPTVASTVTRSADTSTSATVTRSADVAQITGTNFSSWYNNSEGTFSITVPAVSLSYNLRYLIDCGSSATSGAGESGHILFGNINNTNVAGGTTDVSGTPVAGPSASYIGSIVRIGYAYKVNNFNASVNGTLGTLDTSGTIPTLGAQRLVIGSRFNATFYINRTIARLTYYPTRLTDTQLQNLTK